MTKLISLMLSGKTLQELHLTLSQYPEAHFYPICVDLINTVQANISIALLVGFCLMKSEKKKNKINNMTDCLCACCGQRECWFRIWWMAAVVQCWVSLS